MGMMSNRGVRLGRLADGRTVLALTGEGRVIDVAASAQQLGGSVAALIEDALPGDGRGSWAHLVKRWDDVREALAALASWAGDGGHGMSIDDVQLSAPLPASDARIFAVGANFALHAAQSERAMHGESVGVPARTLELLENKRNGVPPWGFTVLPSTVVGPDAAVWAPPAARKLDYEGEVAAVLRVGPKGDVTVWGLAPWNDFSLRDPHFGLGPRVDEGPLTWSLQKNFDTGSACGPWVVADSGLDVTDVSFRLRVNGELRQDGSTGDMIYGFADIIEHFGHFLTLRDGDVIASGTLSGTAFEGGVDGPYLVPGDTVEVEVDEIGVLRNRIVAAPSMRDNEPELIEGSVRG
jgi:2-keto-4-pentenoate hydratase/2-oxohepta-3-ene-1,7-dioic acid hydratase in catechol pathway